MGKSDQQGVTILEVLAVIAIFGIIFGLGGAGYYSWRQRVQLINTADELRSNLNKVQQWSVAAAASSSWGIHFEPDNYVVFAGGVYATSSPDNVSYHLPGIEIINATSSLSDGLGGFSQEVIFDKFTGYTNNTGTISLIVSGSFDSRRDIIINSSGQID